MYIAIYNNSHPISSLKPASTLRSNILIVAVRPSTISHQTRIYTSNLKGRILFNSLGSGCSKKKNPILPMKSAPSQAAILLPFVPDWMVGSISIETFQRKRLHRLDQQKIFNESRLPEGKNEEKRERTRGNFYEKDKTGGFVGEKKSRKEEKRQSGGGRGKASQGNLWHLVTARHKKEEASGMEGCRDLFVAAFN